ncbi:Pentatricopeptide repeat-containing protein, chloroplastic [Capsicum annuum]|uniref:Pentatricopeptide repeat-containing protein, chloroplastic n=1 Tax=Capsicum annuum TaxID=4072 RepID=A0A2G3ANC1_CAPAN|nr:pentatricopeptide repeat-containing protein At5g55740, chloroplastic [Capsicum annuum]XP_047264681.1 pentatricopeptide repeat-containing protein At5g55740, chloroplastic [Capsicum annuum]PHT95663.1 Pentatricopeptide repeat-containing protein, chloroplastic [Capsicum annuum]
MASLPFNPIFNPHTPTCKPKSLPKFPQTHSRTYQEIDTNNKVLHIKLLGSLCKEGKLQESVDFIKEMECNNLYIGPEFYGEMLQGCVYEKNLKFGQQIHAKILKSGDFYAKNEYIETKLVIFYAKCDLFDVSSNLFCRLRKKNVFSWAAIIGLCCRMNLCKEAMFKYIEMLENEILGDNFVLPNVLKACGALNFVQFGKCVHGHVLKLGFESCVFVASSLIDMYGKCGVLVDSRKVFDYMYEKNVVAWNSLIVSYMQNGFNEEAIGVFYDMRNEGIEPTRVTLSSFLSASANLCALHEGKQGHAISVKSGLDLDNIFGSSLINFYAKVGLVNDAELIFHRVIEKDVVTWNLLMSCYVQSGKIDKTLDLSRLMRLKGFRFDSVTLSTILSASAELRDLKLGREGHCFCVRNTFDNDIVVASGIINMYAKCEKIPDARRVFDNTMEKDLVLWNTLLAAYAEVGLSGESLRLFYQMQLYGLPQNTISWNSVILGLLRNGQINEAIDMFTQMKTVGLDPNIVTYTTLISGLTQNGHNSEALTYFKQLLQAGYRPNSASIVAALSASTNMASLHDGRSIHGYILRRKIPLSLPVATSLVDMYTKCGSLNCANCIFDLIPEKKLALYNAMISGYALHGCAIEALALFKRLCKEGVEPDSITFTSVLSSCCHAGLVKEGLDVFYDMLTVHHMKPRVEHYGCIITLLSRCGDLDEAMQLIQSMPFEPDANVFESLLVACRELRETELEKHIANCLIMMEPDNAGHYVSLSNAYATTGRWDEVSKLRDLMKKKGLRKRPGCSWIQVGAEFHMFVSGDKWHPHTEKISTILALLDREMQLTRFCFNN